MPNYPRRGQRSQTSNLDKDPFNEYVRLTGLHPVKNKRNCYFGVPGADYVDKLINDADAIVKEKMELGLTLFINPDGSAALTYKAVEKRDKPQRQGRSGYGNGDRYGKQPQRKPYTPKAPALVEDPIEEEEGYQVEDYNQGE